MADTDDIKIKRELYNARRRAKYNSDPEYRAKILEKERNKRKDPEQRAKMNARARERHQKHREERNAQRREQRKNDPEYREKLNAPRRERYQNDPEYREKILEYGRTPEAKKRINARNRDRYQNDPEYRKKVNTRNNEKYQTDPDYREKRLSYNKLPETKARKNEGRRIRYQNDLEYRRRQNAEDYIRRFEAGSTKVIHGYVYIFENPVFPGILKVGRASDVNHRRNELSRYTPADYEVVDSEEVENTGLTERVLHLRLMGYRVKDGIGSREFFEVDKNKALEHFGQVTKMNPEQLINEIKQIIEEFKNEQQKF